MQLLKTLKYYGYFRKHPHFYWRFLQERFLQTFTRKRRLLLSEIFFESRCNFRCWHCSSMEYTETKGAQSLSVKQLDLVLKKLRSVGVLSSCYVGGEPLVRKDLPEIIRLTDSRGVLPSLVTNAFLLNEQKIDELFDAGLANMGFSLQSMDPAMHDELVNHKGAHTRMMTAIEYCRSKKYVISICVVPTKENLANGDFDRLVQFACERDMRINANLPAPIGKLLGNTDSLLGPEQLQQLEDRYIPLPNFLPDFKQTSLARKMRCPMGENTIYILPDGEVCPCTFTHISFGNILTEPIQTILARLDASPTLNALPRDGRCPISEDPEFIEKLTKTIRESETYPPSALATGF